MKLPPQAPAVVRETYSWQARPPAPSANGLLPAINCGTAIPCGPINGQEWCCDADLSCGTVEPYTCDGN